MQNSQCDNDVLVFEQESLPSEEDGLVGYSSLLPVLLHRRHFSTDSGRAELRRQTTVCFALLPGCHQTGVIAQAPHLHPQHVNATTFVLLIHYFTADVSPSSSHLMTHSVCVLSGEHLSLLLKDPDQPDGSKALKVAIIGPPNAGKSTLSNQLLGRKVTAALLLKPAYQKKSFKTWRMFS